MDSPDWAGDGEMIAAMCNYQLVLGDLMDLTHEESVHSSSIGQDELSESAFEVTYDDRSVTVSRWMRDIEAPAFWLLGAGQHSSCEIHRARIEDLAGSGLDCEEIGQLPIRRQPMGHDGNRGCAGTVLRAHNSPTGAADPTVSRPGR